MKRVFIVMFCILTYKAYARDCFVKPTIPVFEAVAAVEKVRLEQPKVKIGLCAMATGSYNRFIEPLYESVKRYFFTHHDIYEVWLFIFSDGPVPCYDHVVRLYQKKLGWPYDTMMRFHTYYANRSVLAAMDYLYFCDVDMYFTDYVGPEILSDHVATRHPGFCGQRKDDYEKDSCSAAYVAPGQGNYYFAGGFYGGKRDRILSALVCCARQVDDDLAHGIIAEWHDESHWNKYCADNPPTLVLGPEYCCDEVLWYEGQPHVKKKLVNVVKDHKIFQGEGTRQQYEGFLLTDGL
jgi:histo-blood group ABO system transferase